MFKSSPFQIVLLALFGGLAVAGVFIFALVVSGGNNSAVGQVTVWGTFDESRVQAVIRAAAETDDRLTGVTYVRKDPTTYENDLVNALASGTGPDLFFLSQDWAYHDAGKTIHIPSSSLSATQFSNTFLDAAAPFLMPDGVIAVPLVADPLVLFWNKDLLAAGGLTVPPRYWDEYLGIMQKLTTKSDSGEILKSGIALGEYRNVTDAKDILAALILQAGGSITTADGAGKVTSTLSPQQGNASQPGLAALRFYTSFADPSQDVYSWNRSLPDAVTAFAQGNVAFYIGHASESSSIKQTNPNLSFAMAPVPQVRSAPKLVDTARVYGLAVPRTAKNPQGGLTVAYIFASPSVSQGFASVLGMASALRAVASASTVTNPNANAGTLQALLATAPKTDQDLINGQAYLSMPWIDPDPIATGDIFRAMIEDTVSGALKPQDALTRADKAMNQLLGI
jgi:ABC-type glycerol-3-phosphate transport system substrate-binding protein